MLVLCTDHEQTRNSARLLESDRLPDQIGFERNNAMHNAHANVSYIVQVLHIVQELHSTHDGHFGPLGSVHSKPLNADQTT